MLYCVLDGHAGGPVNVWFKEHVLAGLISSFLELLVMRLLMSMEFRPRKLTAILRGVLRLNLAMFAF